DAGTYTVRQVAEMFGKDASHIRRLCISLDLGEVPFGMVRLLRDPDVKRLRQHFDEVGRDRGPVWYTVGEVAEGHGESPAFIGRLAAELNLGRMEGRQRLLATADVHAITRELNGRRN